MTPDAAIADPVLADAVAVAAGVMILLAGLLALAAGLGVLRLPDVYIRMHAATKVGTLASGLVMGAVALVFPDLGVLLRCGLIVLFLLLTAPIGAHMAGRAALVIGIRPWGVADEDLPPPWHVEGSGTGAAGGTGQSAGGSSGESADPDARA